MAIERDKIRWNGWGWAAYEDNLARRTDLWDWLATELGMPSLLATPARPLGDIALPPPRLGPEQRKIFTEILGSDRVQDDNYERAFHARGQSYHDLVRSRSGDLSAPDAVLYPRGTDEVLAVLAYASEQNIVVVPFGGGTSVVGGVDAGAAPRRACVTIDLSGMDKLLEVDTVARVARAEAGIYGPALENALQARGVTLGHYPQSFEFSTLGGWIAHRGAGQQSLRYGKAEHWLVSATLATPRGLLITEDFPASAAGPRLSDLVAGSEGAFGIVTEASFHIRPVPQTRDYRGYLFHGFAQGAAAIRQAVQEGVSAAMLRLSDAEETRFYRTYNAVGKKRGARDWIANRFLKWKGIDNRACLMIAGFEGTSDEITQSTKRFDAIAKSHGAFAMGPKPGERWWQGRFHGPYLRDSMIDRGIGVDTLETATSWSKLDTLYGAVREALKLAIAESVPRPGARGIVMCHISHSYPDGASLYFTFIFPRTLDGEVEQWQTIKRAASDAIIANGGTISHHHGVGQDHLPWIAKEKSELGIEILRAIKHTLDPNDILNPGKLIPPQTQP